MAILADVVSLVNLGHDIFTANEPTPEEQKEKGRVWYAMLQDFIVNHRTSTDLANIWRDQLPYDQKNTKKRFIKNHIIGKPTDQIVDVLVSKINDELVKGNFPRLSKEAILSGMGASSGIVSTPSGTGPISAGTGQSGSFFDAAGTETDINEGRVYFYALGIIVLGVGGFTWFFFRSKKRR